jgi:SAM-dependent methyltransferase
MKLLYRSCPICDNVNGEILYKQSFLLLSDSPLPNELDIVSCTDCGFVFADTPADQTIYNNYYAILSKYEELEIASGGGTTIYDYERIEVTTSKIQEIIPDCSSNILDIGCANGGLLKSLRQLGYKKILGIDPSKVCCNHVNNLGIQCIEGDIFSESFRLVSKTFDCIILSHVLEHIRDLDKAIELIKNKLNKNGILYIEVPDASRYNEYYVVPYYYIDCEHINHFSPQALNNLMQNFNLTTIESYQGKIKLNDHIDYPYFYSFFKTADDIQIKHSFDHSVIESFNLFLKQSQSQNKLNIIFEKLRTTQEEVIVWGAGQFALRLLASSALSDVNIIGFVDSDKSKQNKKLGLFNVYSPDFIIDKSATLLICSALYADEIKETVLQLNKDIKCEVLN